MSKVWSRGMPAYAIANQFFDRDAIAMALRNVGLDCARTVIVHASAQDDFAITSAEAVLRMDEFHELDASGKRIIAIFGDGRMSLQTFDESGAAPISWSRSPTPLYSGAEHLRRIRRLTAGVAPQTVPGIGIIRFAPPRGSAAWVAGTAWLDEYHAAVCHAAAESVRTDPSVLERARETLKASVNIGPSFMLDGLLAWQAILSRELPDDALAAVLDALLAQGHEATLLHRTSPFSFLVSPHVREMILNEIDAR